MSHTAPPTLFVFAGEPSGDMHGARLLAHLRMLAPDIRLVGVGGPKMREMGVVCSFPMEEFQVMGFLDVALVLPRLVKRFYALKHEILRTRPQAVLLIDYADFTLRLARSLRKSGYLGTICQYICPSVWAWRKGRIQQMVDSLDKLIAILPFERACFANTSLDVEYVGHPLVEQHTSACVPLLPIESNVPLLALFPGSREKELERNLDMQARVAKRLVAECADLRIAVSVCQERFRAHIEDTLLRHGISAVFVPHAMTSSLMRQATLAIAKSGTVTLELAMCAVPTVVTYGMSRLDLWIARDLFRIRLPFYCLVNIIAEETVFPELFGPHLREESLYHFANRFLSDPDAIALCKQQCASVRALLGAGSASASAAKAVYTLCTKVHVPCLD